MALDELFDKLKHEAKALLGEESKDKYFPVENEFPDEAAARNKLPEARRRLFDINTWTEKSGLKSTFELYDKQAQKTNSKPETGFFMKIILPGVPVENWVEITHLTENETLAEFTVHPCSNPTNSDDKTQHFFVKETSSTFRVMLSGKKLIASEIGKNEVINNQEEAGNRSAINTLIAEGGWAGVQKIQWESLAEYWCCKKD